MRPSLTIYIHTYIHRTTGLLIDMKQKQKLQMLNEKLDERGARREHTPRKSLQRVGQETGVPTSSARTAKNY
jgi:hypothetical protein